MEKGPRVIFQSDVVVERGGGGGFASGERGVGFFGSRINGRSSNFELGSDSGFGPGRVLGWCEMQPRPQNGCGPRRVVGRREMQLGSSDGPVGKSNSTLSHFKREQVDKWAFLFKRPFKSKLVAIKNKKWVRRRDPGAGPSFRGEDGVVTIDGGCRETTCSSKRQPECVSYQQSFPASVDSSEVCMISERFSPSLPPSFSFAEERRGGVNSKDLGGLDVSAAAVCFGDPADGRNELVNEGVWSEGGECKGRVIRDSVVEVGEGGVTSGGLEIVPFSGGVSGEGLDWGGCTEEEVFYQLGWVHDLVDDRLAVSNDVFSPVAVREVEGSWDDGKKLVSGMSQEEVSKWVLKRINA